MNDIELQETGTDLIVAEAQRNAIALFTDGKRYSDFYERVKASVSTFEPDVSTEKGRREIASVAFRVTKAKTTLDKAGFALTEEWRKKTAAVNAARKRMVTELDELADEIRRPLTEWEKREAERSQRVDQEIQHFRSQASVGEDEAAADVERRCCALDGYVVDPDLYQDRLDEGQSAKEAAVEALRRAVQRLRQEEADRAELERLRREAAEREEAERLAREKREREEQERREREQAERRRAEEKERRKAEIAAAEQRARVEAEQRARAEERRAADERLAEERRQREAAEAEAAEARRNEQERLAWEERERMEREKREADERHRKAVIAEVAEDISAALFNAEQSDVALAVANAIAAGTVRHVSVRF